MVQGKPEFDGIDLTKIRVGNTYPAAMPMEVAIQGYGYLNSLERCLLINRSEVPFLCSDNPVIFYNSQRSHFQEEGVIGLDSSGLQVFYPIDHRRSIYLYDESIYSRPSNTGVRIIRKEDAINIGIVQYMWSDRNIYAFPSYEMLIRKIAQFAGEYLPYERVCFRESEMTTRADGTCSSLLLSFRAQAPIETAFSFARHHKSIGERETGARSRPHQAVFAEGAQVKTYKFGMAGQRRRHMKGAALSKAISSIAKL